MKPNIAFLSFFAFATVQSQVIEGVIKDAETKEPLSYANLTLLSKNIGASSNENGRYTINVKGNTQDSLLVSYLGYTSKKISLVEYKAKENYQLNFELNPDRESIDEVVLKVKKQQYTAPKSINIRKKTTKYGTAVQYGMENCVLIKNKRGVGGKVKKISFYLTKNEMSQFRCYDTYYRVKFYAFDEDNNQPGKLLSYYPYIIIPKGNEKEKITIELEDKHVLFPKNGICIGIETINPEPLRDINPYHTTKPNLTWTYDDEALTWYSFRGRNWVFKKGQLESKGIFSKWKKNFSNPLIDVVVRYKK